MAFFSIIKPLLKKKDTAHVVSIIGGGGKSTLLQKIGKELVERKLKVILTSTTKIEAFSNIALVLLEGNQNVQTELSYLLRKLKIVLVAQERYKNGKLIGVHPEIISKLRLLADVILVEADGARQRSLKSHKEHEPVIPTFSNDVIMVVGADVVGEELNAEQVHRAELFSKKWQVKAGSRLTPKIIVKELLSPKGYVRNIPSGSRISIFVNKSDLNLGRARKLARHLKANCNYPVYLGSLKDNSMLSLSLAKPTDGFPD